MMQQGPWAKYGGQTPAPVVVGTPNPRIAVQDARAAEDQALQRQANDRAEAAARRADAVAARQVETAARQTETAARMAQAAMRLPTDKEKELRSATSEVSSLNRSLSGFNDDYLGMGSGIENTAQEYLNVGTPGQRDWWANFRSSDNLIRNELFGASLTAGEKSAYAATTITPDMSPEQARINITRRTEIARTGLKRYRDYLVESGYSDKAIDTLVGPALSERAMSADTRPGVVQFADEAPDKSANSYRLTAEQEAAFSALAQTGANEQQLEALARSFGAGADPENLRGIVEFYRDPSRRSIPTAVDYQKVDAIAPINPGDGGVGAAARGVGDSLTLGFLDELTAVPDALQRGVPYTDALDRQRGIAAYDIKEQFAPRVAGQIAGGLALPSFGATGAGQLARVGAGYGGVYGIGSSDGGLGQRLTGGATGAATGGLLGYGLGRAGQALADRGGGVPPPPTGGQELLAAARAAGVVDDAGIPLILPADAGGPLTRRMTAGVAQTPFGTGPITQAADRAQNAAGARLGQIAASEGLPLRQEQLGELAQNAAQGYIDDTGRAANRGYNRARAMARIDGTRIVRGDRALQNIDDQIAGLAETRNTDAPLISGLERLRSDIATGDSATPLSIDAIRRLRTSTRAEARSEGLRNTDYNRRAQTIIDDLSEDIASQLSPRAAAAFREADQAYAQRLDTIDDVMAEVIGPAGDRSAEAVARRLISLGRGDSARLNRFLNAVNPEEAGIVRGSLIQEAGRSLPGQQNAAGNGFSFSTFLSNWDNMPARTRNLLFRGENRDVVEALAIVAERARATSRYANTSGTAGASNASGFVTEGTRALSIGGAISSLGGTVILENLTGRLLGSQRFAQWIARAPKDPAQRGAWVRRLGVIASREPAIANDVLPLQQALQQTLEQLPARAAASQQTGQNPQE